MALLESKVPIKPVTGFARIDNAGPKTQIIPVVDNPIPSLDTSLTRTAQLLNGSTLSLQDIQNGYMTDSHIHQAVTRYAEKVIKEGYYLSGANQAAVKYVQTRLEMMTPATGTFWQKPFIQALRDGVKYANAFMIKRRFKKGDGPRVKGIRKIQGLNNKGAVGGYSTVSPLYMVPKFDSDRVLVNWELSVPGASEKKLLDLDDVIHHTYDKQSGGLYGISWLLPVLDDVRALRIVEEMVVHLIAKSLTPLIHHEVPDTTGTGRGRQEDVNRAAQQHNIMAVNGYIITPPNHKISMIGVESKALRAEGYLKVLRERVYAGLGVNPVMMGESGVTGIGVAESFTAVMHDRVRFIQKEFADTLTYEVIWELLLEGGFNPYFDERDRVYWKFNEVDVDRRIKEESHALLLYHGNAITEDELRQVLNLGPLSDSEREKTYSRLVKSSPVTNQGQSGSGEESGSDLKGVLSRHVLSVMKKGEPLSEESLMDAVSTYVEAMDRCEVDLIEKALHLAISDLTGSESPAAVISRIQGYLDIYAYKDY